jgi:hypothetical protein
MGFAHLLQRLLLLLGQRFCRRHRSPPSSRRIADGRQLGHSDHARIDGVIGHDHLGRALRIAPPPRVTDFVAIRLMIGEPQTLQKPRRVPGEDSSGP